MDVLGVPPDVVYSTDLPELLEMVRAKTRLEERKAAQQKAAQDREATKNSGKRKAINV